MSDTKEILESGLRSPFWPLFCAHVEREWGPQGLRYQAELDQALNLTDNDAAASQARQIRSAQKAILGLLRWPQDELKRLTHAPAEDTPPGRAPLDQELVGQSRRGAGL